jgi:hypothetical protein
MNNIRIGSLVRFKKGYSDSPDDKEIHMGEVIDIKPCGRSTHEGCSYCVGHIYLKPDDRRKCFKKTSSWETRIVSIENIFIEEDEFKI